MYLIATSDVSNNGKWIHVVQWIHWTPVDPSKINWWIQWIYTLDSLDPSTGSIDGSSGIHWNSLDPLLWIHWIFTWYGRCFLETRPSGQLQWKDPLHPVMDPLYWINP